MSMSETWEAQYAAAGFIQITSCLNGNTFLIRASTICSLQGAPEGKQKALIWTIGDPDPFHAEEPVVTIVKRILATL
jgi:hypothetical protein